MGKGLLPAVLALFFVAGVGLMGVLIVSIVSAGDTTRFEVDVAGPESPPAPVLGVQVPDSLYLGGIEVGEQTDSVRLDINNTGNVAIIVTPQLTANSDSMFNNLYFRRRTTESYYQVGEYNHNISAPTTSSVKSDYMYVKLDLRDYAGSFNEGTTTRITSDVKFLAVAQ